MSEPLSRMAASTNEASPEHQVVLLRLANELSSQSEELANQMKELADVLNASLVRLKLESKRTAQNARARRPGSCHPAYYPGGNQ